MKTYILNIKDCIAISNVLSPSLLTLSIAICIAACGNKNIKNPETDRITVTRSVHLTKDSDSPMCKVSMDIIYVKDTEGEKSKSINNAIEKRLFDMSDVGMKHAADSFATRYTTEYMENFAALYKADRGDENKTSWYNFYYNIQTSVGNGKPGVMVYKIDSEYYEGGAHSIKQIFYLNFDNETGKPLTVNDIFVPGHTKQLNSIVLDALKEKAEAEDINELQDKGYLCSTEMFVPENFIIGEDGITFIYNTYEIAPYDNGMTELYIRYSDIRKLMKSDNKNS
ncbi:RsiV family protein [Xylanibacter muris]|uniref:DUF3298 domain-containing protein n=1 Tax=Xylanibacter muris TaxID=2736290 RepID=A0ABX2AP83_9BACT|nr:RsiV family protein [Xylanibacter muris]NPD93018.1 DUF3298 domain-containing protein [Xylanibacter muris]